MESPRKRLNVHFPYTLAVSFFFLGVCVWGLWWSLGHYSDRDVEAYNALVHRDEEGEESPTQGRQIRQGIDKDIFIDKQGQQLHIALKSAVSELSIDKHHRHAEAAERLGNADCWIQEKIVELPGGAKEQIALFLRAEDAVYRYQEQKLTASRVDGMRYLAPGTTLVKAIPDKGILMTGTAETVDIAWEGSNPVCLARACRIVAPGIGIASAALMKLEASSQGVLSCDRLAMEGDVAIDFADGGRLECARAAIDPAAKLARFFGGGEDGLAVFTDGKGNPPSVVKGKRMAVACIPDDADRPDVAEITVDEDASLTYGDTVATGDNVLYRRGAATVEIHGDIRGEPETRRCAVVNANGDVIRSKKIDVDLNKKTMVFDDAEGVVASSEPVAFSADEVTWDDKAQRAMLKGHVVVTQQGIGELHAQDRVVIQGGSDGGKKKVIAIATHGETCLNYVDSSLLISHTLKCYGTVKVDHEKMESRFLSPKNSAGTIDEGRQVAFEDAKGEAYADKAFVKYANEAGKLVPVRIVLQGNVKIYHKASPSETGSVVPRQYILADRLEFFPQTREMRIQGSKDQRVLFYDEANDMQVSAPALKLLRDEGLKKEAVEGVGGIRLRFSQQELEQLRRRFPFDRLKEKEQDGEEDGNGKAPAS